MEESIQDKLQQGIELMSTQKFKAAKSVFKGILEVDNRNFDAYVNLGNAHVNLEEYEQGIDAFKKAQLLQPDSSEVLYSLGCCHFLMTDYVEALKCFNRCEERGFAPAEMYGLMELIFIDTEDFTQAIRCANRIIAIDPLDPQAYIDKAQLYVMQEKPREAIASLREVEELLPDSGETYLVESQIYLQSGEPDQAVAVLDRAISRFPKDPMMLLTKVRALNDMGRYPDALALLGKVQDLAGDDENLQREATMQVSVAQAGLKNLDASVATLARSVEAEPADADMLFLLANECFALKRYEEAERYAKQLASIEGVNPRYRAAGIFWEASAINELGRKEEAQKAFKDATTTLRQLTIANPGLFEVYIYRALCNKEIGAFDEAVSLIDHVIQLLPEEASGYAFKAQILEAQGDGNGAKEMREKALSLDPDFEF